MAQRATTSPSRARATPRPGFTEPRENFNHEHQNTQVVNGVQLGDLIQYVDFDFVARVTGVNAAALWALASSPGMPKNAQIHTNAPVNFAGTNLTSLQWDANPESDLTGYEVVIRETTDSDWTSAIPVGNVTLVTLNISKDNVQFGIRAVDQNGNAAPLPSRLWCASRGDPGHSGCPRPSRGLPPRPPSDLCVGAQVPRA